MNLESMRRLLEEDASTELARYKRLCFGVYHEFRSLANETIMNDANMFNFNSSKVYFVVQK